MRAIVVGKGRELTWAEVPEPEPKPGEVLIEIHATALNRADLMQRAGNYPPPPGAPEWMGLECAGVVLEAPEDSRFLPGDKVCALLGGGGYAEKVAVPAPMVLPVPEGLSMAQAAAIPEAFATAYLNICIEGAFRPGETVLIHAGASGLGMAAIQLVKALGGKVVTTVGSNEKVEFVRNLGADVAVNRKAEDLAEVMDAHPVDVALDCVSGPGLGKCIVKMARGGRWVVIATLGGEMTEIDMGAFFRKGLRLIGSTLRSRTPEMKGEILTGLEKTLWSKFSSGEIEPVIYKTLPIVDAQAAHAILERNENVGKVVLRVGRSA